MAKITLYTVYISWFSSLNIVNFICRTGTLYVNDARLLQGRPRLHHHVRSDTTVYLPECRQMEEGPGHQVFSGRWLPYTLSTASQQGAL